MGTPKRGYYDKDGERIPSVTTVLSKMKDSGGLIHWAWECGKRGEDYRDVRDKAGFAGTIAHEMIRAHVFCKPYQPPGDTPVEVAAKASEAFRAFLRWYEQSGIRIIATEQSLVDEDLRYGGTLDAIGTGERGACLLDWKSSKGRYPEYIVQLAAYRHLANPHFGPINEAHLLWIDKESGSFAHFGYEVAVLDRAFQAFRNLRELYDMDKELKRLV